MGKAAVTQTRQEKKVFQCIPIMLSQENQSLRSSSQHIVWNQMRMRGMTTFFSFSLSLSSTVPFVWIVRPFRFYPSVAKKIAYDIAHAELHDQDYDEEDAKNWSLVLSDKIRDALRSKRGRGRDWFLWTNFFLYRKYEHSKI